MRLTPLHDHGVVIRERHFHRRPVRVSTPKRDANRFEIFVGCQLPPVRQVYCGDEIHTIGPFDSLAEVPGEGLARPQRFPIPSTDQARNRCSQAFQRTGGS